MDACLATFSNTYFIRALLFFAFASCSGDVGRSIADADVAASVACNARFSAFAGVVERSTGIRLEGGEVGSSIS